MLILYATESGTSQFLADMFFRQLIAHDIPAEIADIQDYNIKSLPQERLVIFFVSTAGDGEPPQSMVEFWNFLLIKSLPSDSLKKVQFSVFGCGDSSYEKFNYAARKLRSRLLQLSAEEKYPSAFGDEQHPCGVETEYLAWSTHFFEDVRVPKQLVECTPAQEEPSIAVKEHRLVSKWRLTPVEHSKDTTSYNFESKGVEYECGDIVRVRPRNSASLVQKVMGLLGLEDSVVEMKWKAGVRHFKQAIPARLRVSALLAKYLDLTTPPKRNFIQVLAQCVDDPQHREKLHEMSSQTKEGLEQYYRYVERERRNVAEILYDFQPCNLTLSQLVESLTLIRPREYSISSTPQDQVIGITVALVHYKTSTNRQIFGFCTKFLQDLQPNDAVQLDIKKGSFRL